MEFELNIFSDYITTGRLNSKVYSLLFHNEKYFHTLAMPLSQFVEEMKMTSTERMEKIAKCKKSVNTQTLTFLPDFVVFQNYEVGSTYDVMFSVINYTKKMIMCKVIFESTSTFNLQPAINFIRLAPGMKTLFTVTFIPSVNVDFLHKIIFDTNKDKFTIPIISLGPRPMLDFCDKIVVPIVPVKTITSIKVPMRNIGQVGCSFTLVTKRYFSVEPAKVYLAPNEFTNISIQFQNNKPGPVEDELIISFDTGERLKCSLHGCCDVVNVKLERSFIEFPKCYVGLTQHIEGFKIINESPHRLDFTWMRYESEEEDLLNVHESFEDFKRMEYNMDNIDSNNPSEKDFEEDLHLLYNSKPHVFHDRYFSIFPISEDVWPHTEKEIVVSFKSNKTGFFKATAYCNIAGCVNRLPLAINSTCYGSLIRLEFYHITLNLSFGTEYHFNLKVFNEGAIPGEIFIKPQSSNFGIEIKCLPTKMCIQPGHYKLFKLSLLSYTPGAFVEDILFNIINCTSVHKLTIKGNVDSPSLIITPQILDFGIVSLGFESMKYLKLKNCSKASLQVKFKIPTDGIIGPSINVMSFKSTLDKPKLPSQPTEFFIKPSSCIIEQLEEKIVKVKLVANIPRIQETVMELCFQGSDMSPVSIPIRLNACLPNIVSLTPSLCISQCFLNYRNKTSIIFQNNSDAKGYYYPIVQCGKKSGVLWELNPSEGIIEANETVSVDLFLETQTTGKKCIKICFQIFGSSVPVGLCLVELEGTGPLVTCHPEVLHWGEVLLLVTYKRQLTLMNDSPIEAVYVCKFNQPQTFWCVTPSEGVLAPGENIDLEVSLTLKDADIFSNKLIINIDGYKDITVPMSAKGTSTSIMVKPPVKDTLDLDYQFTHKRIKFPLLMTNYGSKTHTLKWSTVNEIKRKGDDTDIKSFFHFNPQELKLYSMESQTVYVEAYCDKIQSVTEHWNLYASIDFGKKELLLETDVKATFIKPTIDISKDQIIFQINQGPYEKQFYVLDYIVLKNTSLADLDVELSINFPFQLVLPKSSTGSNDRKKDPLICGDVLAGLIENNPKMRGFELTMQTQSERIQRVLNQKSFTDFDMNNVKDVIKKFGELFDLSQKQNMTLEQEKEYFVNLLFNGSFGQNYRPEKFTGSLVIKFLGHPKKEKVCLVGEINYPDVVFSPMNLHMECVPCASSCTYVVIENATPLTIKYKLVLDDVFIQPLSYSEPQSVETYSSLTSSPTVSDVEINNSIQDLFRGMLEQQLSKMIFISDNPAYNQMEEVIQEAISLALDKIERDDFEYFQHCLENRLSLMFFINEHESYPFIHIMLERIISETLDMYDSISNYFDVQEEEEGEEVCPSDSFEGKSLNLHDILIISPDRGKMKPFEVRNLSVRFDPLKPIFIKTTVLCYLQGGPTRYFVIQAESADIEYFLSATSLNFNICEFHNVRSESVTLTNTGRLSFDFSVSSADLDESLSYSCGMQMSLVSVSPNSGHLVSGQSVELVVKITPGIFGRFKKSIALTVGSFEPIGISIEGWGVFPQLDVALNFYDNEVSSEITYTAVGSLTDSWLEACSRQIHLKNPSIINIMSAKELVYSDTTLSPLTEMSPNSSDNQLTQNKVLYVEEVASKYNRDKLMMEMSNSLVPSNTPNNETSADPCAQKFIHKLEEDGWVVINKSDSDVTIPTMRDINMAIERILVCQHVAYSFDWKNKSLDSQITKRMLLFTTPKRYLNFGTVVGTNQVSRSVHLYIYSMCDVTVKVLKRNKFPPWISVTLPNTLKRSIRNSSMTVTLKMDTNMINTYVGKEISYTFQILVSYGVIIPIVVTALLAMPDVKTIPGPINFGSVICGDFKICSVPIVNTGYLISLWSVSLVDFYSEKSYKKNNLPLVILNSSGKLNPGECDTAKVCFKPTQHGIFNVKLILCAESGQSETMLQVTGKGLSPNFELIGSHIKFDPMMAHSIPQELIFAIYNPNSFPIKIAFQSCSMQMAREIEYVLKFTEVDGKVEEMPLNECVYKEMNSELWSPCEPLMEVRAEYTPLNIVFFGAPLTDCYYTVKKFSSCLNLKTLNLDSLLIKSVAYCDLPASTQLKNLVNQTYDVMENALQKDPTVQTENFECMDEIDILEYKIEALMASWDPSMEIKKSSAKKTKPAKSEMSSTYRSDKLTLNNILNISESLMVEVLSEAFMRYPKGFIIDNLHSKLFDSPNAAFLCILKSLFNANNVHLIVFHNSFEHFSNNFFMGDVGEDISEEQAKRKSRIMMEAETEFHIYDTELKQLLTTVDYWNIKTHRLEIPKAPTKGSKAAAKNKKGKATPTSSIAEFDSEDVGLTSWILHSSCDYAPNLVLYHLSQRNAEQLADFTVLEKPILFAQYTQLQKNIPFKDEEPFRLICDEKIMFHMCFCKQQTPSYKDECHQVQEFLMNSMCSCGIACSDIYPHITLEDDQDSILQPYLPPKYFMKFKMTFRPQNVGAFSQNILIVSKGLSKPKKIMVQGICDLPRIEESPWSIFPNVISTLDNEKEPNGVFDLSKEEFNFGLVLYTLNEDCVVITKEKLIFTNVSSLPLEMILSFVNQDNWYELSTSYLNIQPGASRSITISVKPDSARALYNTLICSIKNNPKVLSIQLTSFGVLASFSISPDSSIDFGKTLLYRQESQMLKLVNSCKLPLLWSIRNLEDFSGDMRVSKEKGALPGLTSEQVCLTFVGSLPCPQISRFLYIDVFAPNGHKVPVLTFQLSILTECYDVVLDCVYEPPEETHFKFGDMMVVTSKTLKVNLINRGMYNLVFRIVKIKKCSPKVKKLLEMAVVKPWTGVLKPDGDSQVVELSVNVLDEISLQHYTLMECQLIDAIKDQRIVAVFPLKVTLRGHCSKIILDPEEDINFGIQIAGTEISRTLKMTNIGHFKLEYQIIVSPCSDEIFRSKMCATNKENLDLDTSPRDLSLKMVSIVPQSGSLQPKEVTFIQVVCNVKHVGFHCEELIFMTDNMQASRTKRLAVLVDGREADIDFWNSSVTFKDCIVVDQLDLLIASKEMDPYCVFAKNEQCLYFMRTCVEETASIRVYLYNNSKFQCSPTFSIDSELPGQSVDFFSVNPARLEIAPMCMNYVTISFSPTTTETCKAIFKVAIEMSPNYPTKYYLLPLIAHGVSPQISFTPPVEVDENFQGNICLPFTFLNDMTTTEIHFENITEIKCVVNVILSDDNDNAQEMFYLLRERPQLGEDWNPEEPLVKKYSQILKRNEGSKILVYFRPKSIGVFKCQINIEIEHNPAALYVITVVGRSFYNNIHISDLKVVFYTQITPQRPSHMSSRASVQSTESTKLKRMKLHSKCKFSRSIESEIHKVHGLNENVSITYIMNIGSYSIGSIVRRNIVICNHSTSEAYRFEWEPAEFLSMSPSIGHIMPDERKNILISFHTNRLFVYEKTPIACNIGLLEFPEEMKKNIIGWDNRHQTVIWEYDYDTKSNLRQVQQVMEPDNIQVSLPHTRLIILMSCSVIDNNNHMDDLME